MNNKSDITTVLYVLKRNAKQIKIHLEKNHWLDKAYRLTNIDVNVKTIIDAYHDGNDDDDVNNNDKDKTIYIPLQTHETRGESENNVEGDLDPSTCIAIPVIHSCYEHLMTRIQQSTSTSSSSTTTSSSSLLTNNNENYTNNNNNNNNTPNTNWENILPLIIGIGKQSCLYSSSTLGNTNPKFKMITKSKRHQNQSLSSLSSSSTTSIHSNMNTIKQALLHTIKQYIQEQQQQQQQNTNQNRNDGSTSSLSMSSILLQEIITKIQNLSITTCPNKIETIGDDRTIVLPYKALNIHTDEKLHDLIVQSIIIMNHCHDNDTHEEVIKEDDYDDDHNKTNTNYDDPHMGNFHQLLWKNLGEIYQTARLVRRGEIDPNSKIRHSGHILIWMSSSNNNDDHDDEIKAKHFDNNANNNKGWITITEQGIKQSFDLTKVMFSRGNISEKIRFGQIVKENEIILDMYAGIGYYTLPALIYGKAQHVYACEWNPDAIYALKFNLKQNGIPLVNHEDNAHDNDDDHNNDDDHDNHDRKKKMMKNSKCTIIEGDSRIRLKEDQYRNVQVDRISLGLLPSSEGGWRTAIRALNKERGGWLHVHGNVPVTEHEDWCLWTCQQLSNLHMEEHSTDQPFVICHHLERVKSFAPKVDHLVADIFVGPTLPLDIIFPTDDEFIQKVGMIQSNGVFCYRDEEIDPPSCALNSGILHQDWMKDT